MRPEPGEPTARRRAATEPPEAPDVTAVVPTIGGSPWLAACLLALRRQEGVRSLEIVVVDQAPQPLALPPGLADRVLRPQRNLGFTGGTNLGIAAARGELLATVNDDAVVEPGWLATLAAALRFDPRAAAAQGVNLLADARDLDAAYDDGPLPGVLRRQAPNRRQRIDSCGLGWNRWWQAIQLGHGMALAELDSALPAGAVPGTPAAVTAVASAAPESARATPDDAPIEVFGVSATAALFRRAALARVAPDGQVFDPRLISYYEDAELAGRLRAAGFHALLAPAARALHAGSASGRAAPASRRRWRLIYGNRYLVAARLLGRGLWLRLPRMLLRDLLDLAGPFAPRRSRNRRAECEPGDIGQDAGRGAGRRLLPGVVAGWGRALRHLPEFAHRGVSAPPLAEVARLSRWPPQSG
jgi:N-acetylglucosaminyl-diphospho-decaprenol L-rhamnosyltransferase